MIPFFTSSSSSRSKRWRSFQMSGCKQVAFSLLALVVLVVASFVKIRSHIDPHYFTETEAIRILEIKKPGLCNKPTVGVDMLANVGTYRGYPKYVHRIFLVWRGHSGKMPESWAENLRLCKQKTPDFEQIVWDDRMVQAFFKQHYPWFLSTYDAYAHDVMRVDAAKYFILYHYGGIYLDLDERCMADLKLLIDKMPEGHGMSIPQGNPTGLSNAVYMARSCHSFLGYVISRMRHDYSWYAIPYVTIMFSSGPRFLSFKYQEYLDLVETPADAPIHVFPTAYVIEHKYIEKIGGQTWFSWDGAIIFTFYKIWRKITFQIPV